jgi:hypothetical protein
MRPSVATDGWVMEWTRAYIREVLYLAASSLIPRGFSSKTYLVFRGQKGGF